MTIEDLSLSLHRSSPTTVQKALASSVFIHDPPSCRVLTGGSTWIDFLFLKSLNSTMADNLDPEPSDGALLCEQQEARAFLRERFLKAMTRLVGQKATFEMAGETVVRAEFGGIDFDFQEVFVKDLCTPLGVQPNALLRASDIISIGFQM